MGILDALMKNPEMIGNVAKFASENPEIAKAAMSLLSSGEGTVGGSGGLAGVVGALQSNGLGDAVASWLGSEDNKAVSPQKIESALGSDTLASFADKAGVSGSEASTLLAGMLPQLVDKLSPDGKLPDSGGLENMLGGLLGSLGNQA
jgi:uncharacterized protein YidB (DUF937 family)